MLSPALVPESDSLQRQLLLWLRSQLLTLPVFANVTVTVNSSAFTSSNGTSSNSTVSNSSTVPGPLEIAISQVKQDISYFVVNCTIQVILLLVLAALLVQVCRWRARMRRRHKKSPLPATTVSREMLVVYSVDGANHLESNDADRSSLGEVSADGRSSSAKASVMGDAVVSSLRVRQHRCLVVSMLLLLSLLFAAAAVSIALLIQFWNAGNLLQSRMLSDAPSNYSSSDDNATFVTYRASTLDLADQINRLIESSIKSGNDTLINEFEANFYIIQNFFNRFARNIIDQLFVLLKMNPVLEQLEAFISKIEAAVYIKGQANILKDELQEAIDTVKYLKENLRGSIQNLCVATKSPDCVSILRSLDSLLVQVDSKTLQLDGLITVTTFMQKENINVTKLRSEFTGTYASINQALNTIDAEVLKLLGSVTVGIATEFNKIKNSTDPVALSLIQTVSSDSVWSSVQIARSYFVAGVIVLSLALVPFYVFAVLLITGLTRCLCWFLSSMAIEGREDERLRLRLDDLNSLDIRPERIGGCPVAGISAAALRREDSRKAKLREYRQRCVCSFRQLSGASRTYAGWSFAVSLVSVIVFSLPVCALYVTGVANNRMCRYLSSTDGRATLDANIDSLLLQQLWPGVTQVLQDSLKLPIPFDFKTQPNQLFTRLYTQCENSTLSLFSAFGMTEVINLTAFVYSPSVQSNLDYGKGMLHTALKSLTPNTVLSTDLQSIGDNPQVKALAKLIDDELNRPELISQLSRSLFPKDLNTTALTRSIKVLEASDPNSSAAKIADFYATDLETLPTKYAPLQSKITSLVSALNATLMAPTAIATIDNLSTSIARYKKKFEDFSAVTDAADKVYDATVVVYLPLLVGLLEPMKVRILTRMLPCIGLLRLMQSGVELACSDVVESTMQVAGSLLLSLLALLLSICLFLGLLLQVSGFCCVLRGDCCCCCGGCGSCDNEGGTHSQSSDVG